MPKFETFDKFSKKWRKIEDELEDLEMSRSKRLTREIQKRRKEKNYFFKDTSQTAKEGINYHHNFGKEF